MSSNFFFMMNQSPINVGSLFFFLIQVSSDLCFLIDPGFFNCIQCTMIRTFRQPVSVNLYDFLSSPFEFPRGLSQNIPHKTTNDSLFCDKKVYFILKKAKGRRFFT